MRTMNVTDFKARCLAVLDEVDRTGETVVLVRRGKPIARVVASRAEAKLAPFHQRFGDAIEIVGDVVAPVAEGTDWDAVRGEWEPRKSAKSRRR